MIVNIGFEAPVEAQLSKLQRLYADYAGGGFYVLAIPSYSFCRGEPPTEAEIAERLAETYRVTFPVTVPYPVVGRDTVALFRELVEAYGTDILPRDDFYKYLFDRKGQMIEYWPTRIEPDDTAISHQLTRHLQSWRL